MCAHFNGSCDSKGARQSKCNQIKEVKVKVADTAAESKSWTQAEHSNLHTCATGHEKIKVKEIKSAPLNADRLGNTLYYLLLCM